MLETIQTTVALQNGVEMPILGLGTYTKTGDMQQAVRDAIEIGYRGIDTASSYGNETEVGRAVRDSGIARDDLFLTTKLWNDAHGYDEALKAFDASLQRLEMDYVDLYLIHWPVRDKFCDSWRALEQIYEQGRARAIGVSNFLLADLHRLLDVATIRPMVNQFEFHPHLQQPELVKFCQDEGIQVEAWSPLMKGEAFRLPELQRIGQRHGKSGGQVVLRWQIQRRVVTIPKSVKRDHLESNAAIFDFQLSEEEMQTINAMDQNRRTGPDPASFDF